MFVLGFDFGIRYFGVAVGQFFTLTSSPLFSILIEKTDFLYFDVFSVLYFWKPKYVIVGYPISDFYDNSFILDKIDSFVFILRSNFSFPVFLVNESLSTWKARRLILINKFTTNNRGIIFFSLNAFSAAILVEQWLYDNMFLIEVV